MSTLLADLKCPCSLFENGLRLKGEFHFQGHVRIECEMEGVITAPVDTHLFFGPGSNFKGTLNGDKIELQGKFEGVICSTGMVICRPPCSFQGMIQAQSLIIYPGSLVNLKEGHTYDPELAKPAT
jgi:cytoskeletal protein CcmA (bactofilin family)